MDSKYLANDGIKVITDELAEIEHDLSVGEILDREYVENQLAEKRSIQTALILLARIDKAIEEDESMRVDSGNSDMRKLFDLFQALMVPPPVKLEPVVSTPPPQEPLRSAPHSHRKTQENGRPVLSVNDPELLSAQVVKLLMNTPGLFSDAEKRAYFKEIGVDEFISVDKGFIWDWRKSTKFKPGPNPVLYASDGTPFFLSRDGTKMPVGN